jgi:hypothetical protein
VSARTDHLDAVLDSWIDRHDIGDTPVTVRHYLSLLLRQLWIDDECFSGKRPFGNSGWKYDIYTSLVVNGFIVGRMGDHGEGMIEFNRHEADQLIRDCIYRLSRKPE